MKLGLITMERLHLLDVSEDEADIPSIDLKKRGGEIKVYLMTQWATILYCVRGTLR